MFVHKDIGEFHKGRPVAMIPTVPGKTHAEYQIEAFRNLVSKREVYDIGHVDGFSVNAQSEVTVMVTFASGARAAVHPANLLLV
jgi:hypothetical protein